MNEPQPTAGDSLGRPRAAFLPEVHLLRALAIVSIVAGHAVRWAGVDMSEGTGRWLAVALRNGSVYFVFVAGLLFHHLDAARDYGAYLRNKTRTVLLPYLCWSLPVLTLFALGLRAEPDWALAGYADWSPLARYALYLGIGGHMPHFWFVPMITLFFVGAPLWSRLGRSRWLWPCLCAAIALSLLLPRQGFSREQLSLLRRAGHFASVYLFGIAVSRHRPTLMPWLRRAWPWGLGVGLALLCAQAQRLGPSSALGYLGKLALCAPLLGALEPLARGLRGSLARVCDTLANRAFAIYLAHYYLLLLVCDSLFDGRAVPSAAPEPVRRFAWIALATLTATVVTVAVLRRLLGRHSRTWVGA